MAALRLGRKNERFTIQHAFIQDILKPTRVALVGFADLSEIDMEARIACEVPHMKNPIKIKVARIVKGAKQ